MHNILWLASWYPNRVDAFNGDFIERHAIAVSRLANLTVLVIIKDKSLAEKEVDVEKVVMGNLAVYRVYYGSSPLGGMIEKILSFKKYLQLQKKWYRQIEKERGKPLVVHVHVAMKAGMLARWLKKRSGLPYLVTEHWTGYYPQSPHNIYEANWLFRQLNRRILQDARLVLPVSDALGKIINRQFAQCPCQVIPNVVDTDLFYFKPSDPQRFRFIHPSYMNYQKNPEGILEACKGVRDRGYDFELVMIGNTDERLVAMTTELQLTDNVTFQPAIPYASVALEMQRSSALLLFSRFENLPCVLLEALCCGLPVVSSNVGGIEEVINDTNGLLVEIENVSALTESMISMMENYARYNRADIASRSIAVYNYEAVGRRLVDLYSTLG